MMFRLQANNHAAICFYTINERRYNLYGRSYNCKEANCRVITV